MTDTTDRYTRADKDGRPYSLDCEYPFTNVRVVICECGALVAADRTEAHDALIHGAKVANPTPAAASTTTKRRGRK